MGTGTALLIIVGGLVLVALFVVFIYNRLVRLREQADNGWAQIDVQLKRRHDLIPNLIETVKGYAGHEKETLENVTQARSAAVDASGVSAQAAAENQLSGALGRLMLVVEAYPDLKANENFLSLQEELSSTENKLAFARQAYNDDVRLFNTHLQSFPDNVVAGFFKFGDERDYFELDEEQKKKMEEAPKVQF